ncbi:MAG TPA: nicotinate phosphoribosyltransferase, partial [Acidobacteriota bacterium]
MKAGGLFVTQQNASFLTDLYELTMAAAYWANGVTGPAAFELYFRRLPANRSFVIAAGLEQALHYISTLRFSADQTDWLRSQPPFHKVPSGFFDYLRDFSFTGEVWALPEGTPVFPLEPIVQV